MIVLTLIVMLCSIYFNLSYYVVLVALSFFMTGFAMGLAPICSIYATEVLPVVGFGAIVAT